jgi:hypothetical protein
MRSVYFDIKVTVRAAAYGHGGKTQEYRFQHPAS